MRIYWVNGVDYDSFILGNVAALDSCSLVMIGFGVIEGIDLVDELNGRTGVLREIAMLSRDKKCVICAGIRAALYDKLYLSAVVIDRGKILGISDMTHDVNYRGAYNQGASYRIYDTSLGKIGVVVGDDLFYPEVARALTVAGADCLAVLDPREETEGKMTAVSANSLFNGVVTLYTFGDGMGAIDREGARLTQSGGSILEEEMTLSHDRRYVARMRNDIYNDVFVEK